MNIFVFQVMRKLELVPAFLFFMDFLMFFSFYEVFNGFLFFMCFLNTYLFALCIYTAWAISPSSLKSVFTVSFLRVATCPLATASSTAEKSSGCCTIPASTSGWKERSYSVSLKSVFTVSFSIAVET